MYPCKSYICSMFRLLSVILLFLYSAETVFSPMADLSLLKELPQMYAHCATEDPDIDAGDFIVEHLLNLECVMKYFEKDDEDRNEKPHQPMHQLQSASQTLVIVSKPVTLPGTNNAIYTSERIVYPGTPKDFIPSGFVSDLLRPPIA